MTIILHFFTPPVMGVLVGIAYFYYYTQDPFPANVINHSPAMYSPKGPLTFRFRRRTQSAHVVTVIGLHNRYEKNSWMNK